MYIKLRPRLGCRLSLLFVGNINTLFDILIFSKICSIIKIVRKIILMRGDFVEIYTPPFNITNKMLTLVSRISEKVGKIGVINNMQARPHLRKNNRIKSIHSSLKIEANSLDLGQVRDVINGKTVLGEKKEIQEVKNAYDAYEKLSKINPFDVNELKAFHGIMTKYLVNESGGFRSGEEGVFSGDKCIFMAPPARMVPELMENLFDWLSRSKEEVHPLIMSAVFHYEFVFIHPFSDGNGRMARLWHSVFLTKWNPIFEYIPIESQIEKFQNEYYETIAKCHTEGSSNTFILFILEQIDKILDEFSQQISLSNENVSEYVKKLLDVMEYDMPYTLASLMEQLALKSKETIRRHYIHPALKLNLIQMTIPDKPQSRNQRYIKK